MQFNVSVPAGTWSPAVRAQSVQNWTRGIYTPVAPAPAPAAPQGSNVTAQAVLGLVNQQRQAAGLRPLALDDRLNQVATARSQDMVRRGYFSHNDPDGHDPFWHISQAGVGYGTAGENIAQGQASPQAVMDAWMNSPGHRANILNPSFTRIGIGVVNGPAGPTWTQDFIG